ncbi:SDR family NAD(P)-dependent oxidoreductase [Rufibacter glacialis]|uniref:SDR family NAD(P)-dependent oxidoreductase n=1 Tax=Rufibacter glacialis TaxID=1259555 RepID=A0A5M8QKC7_9BACT|nr:SDR family NAD(P)-dependent oxidoreductase [Rufibacter glacialis]KAA6435698.1 SDR family NAD(P)-dependent oxidoreductase [Rufibacter glacialis]GGK65757.1 short-chain dehydrogenase [Rufibacter glacialis]
MTTQKIALVTGATSGIGRATAVSLAQQGFKIIATGRRTQRLQELSQQLGQENVYPLEFDVRDKEAVQTAIAGLPPEWRSVDVLVNNAGNAHGLSNIQSGDLDDWEAMLDINVKGLLYVTKAVLPIMIERKSGHIINIGSIAGKEVYANGNVYCASKFAVDALSKAMRIDLIHEGLKVSEVNPGAVETEFSEVRFKGDTQRAATVYQGFEALQAEDIADLISFMVTRPKHVNLAEVLILPAAQASATIINKQ